jgi:hypothetical protein
MANVVPLKLKSQTLLIEIDRSVVMKAPVLATRETSPGLPPGGAGVVAKERVEASIEMVKSAIAGVATELYEAVRSIPSPQKVTIEFGVTLAGETSIIPLITKASGDVTFKVAIEWQAQKPMA